MSELGKSTMREADKEIAALRQQLADEKQDNARVTAALQRMIDRLEAADEQNAKKDAALREAKVLIGASNDQLLPAVRESNINRAWWIIDAALAPAAQDHIADAGKMVAPAPSAGETVLVPREPTLEMTNAGHGANCGPISTRPNFIYRAMLAAAPTTEGPK